MATKRPKYKSKSFVEDSDEDESEPKRVQKSEPSEKLTASGDGFDLSARRRVTINEFRGKLLVDIREYYQADGELRPGKKGISLSLEQWEKLKEKVADIDQRIQELS